MFHVVHQVTVYDAQPKYISYGISCVVQCLSDAAVSTKAHMLKLVAG